MVTSRQVCLWKILTSALTCRSLALDIQHPLCRDAQAFLTYIFFQIELFFLGVGQKLRTDMLILQSYSLVLCQIPCVMRLIKFLTTRHVSRSQVPVVQRFASNFELMSKNCIMTPAGDVP